MRILIDGITVECSVGNIAVQEGIAAIVNPAGPGMTPGSGVSGAIHAKAGSGLYQECIAHVPLRSGKPVITAGYLLPSPHVIHCLPPQTDSQQAARQLEQCYIQAMLLAEERGLHSLAFPALATGSFGSPPISATAIALGAVRNCAPMLRKVRRIRFVLVNRHSFMQYRNLMEASTESVLKNICTG